MDKNTHLGQLAVIDAQIKDLTKERDAMRIEAVKQGFAVWNVVLPSTKAPSKQWWEEHRAVSFARLTDVAKNPKHPDHTAFWNKGRKLFKVA